MEEVQPAPAAGRGFRVQHRRRRRRQALWMGTAAGVLLLLVAMAAGLMTAQRGVAELAGPGAPKPPLAVVCRAGHCGISVFGHRLVVAPTW